VPLGVNLEEFSRASTRRQAARPGHLKVLSVGAIKARKGYQTAIEAAALVKREVGPLEYRIVGRTANAAYRGALVDITERLGLAGTVRLMGQIPQEELIRQYHWCDVFVLTPENVDGAFEGFGLVYLEANACGKPVIATRGCGAEEPVRDGFNGFLVPQRDPRALADAVIALARRSDLYDRMCRNARQRAREMTFEKTVESVRRIYEQILQVHG